MPPWCPARLLFSLSLFSSANVGVWRQSPRCRRQVWSVNVHKVNKHSSSLPSQVDWLCVWWRSPRAGAKVYIEYFNKLVKRWAADGRAKFSPPGGCGEAPLTPHRPSERTAGSSLRRICQVLRGRRLLLKASRSSKDALRKLEPIRWGLAWGENTYTSQQWLHSLVLLFFIIFGQLVWSDGLKCQALVELNPTQQCLGFNSAARTVECNDGRWSIQRQTAS